MGRSENFSVPCSVSIAERLNDSGCEENTAEDRDVARTEILDAILETRKGWRGHTLFSVLQEYLNAPSAVYDTRLNQIAVHLQAMMFGNPADREAPYQDRIQLARSDAELFFRGTVEDYIKDEWVDERATEIAGERLELAS